MALANHKRWYRFSQYALGIEYHYTTQDDIEETQRFYGGKVTPIKSPPRAYLMRKIGEGKDLIANTYQEIEICKNTLALTRGKTYD